MTDIFISYARSTEAEARRIADALRALGYGVWRDDELPAHRAYAEVIEERLKAARAVVVVWSAEAVKSQWVRSEADKARGDQKLVQLSLDGSVPPMPFDQIQCADLTGWTGDIAAPGWLKVVASLVDLAAAPLAGAAVEPPPALPSKPSIAVLPFTDMTGAQGQDYFVDGMMEEITTALSRFRSIFVIASSSALSLKGQAVTPQAAARAMGVRYVLEGSVRRSANRVRIAVKLIDAAAGGQIWADQFDDTLEDVFDLQERVALSVASKIESSVQAEEIRRAVARPTDNLGAYDLYLRAVSNLTYSRAATLEAVRLLEAAVDLDPVFGPALGLAAGCRAHIDLYDWSEDLETNSRIGTDQARRALKAAPDDPSVLCSVAYAVAYLDLDLPGAIALADRAILLNPGSATAWGMGGQLRMESGDTDRAVEQLETSLRLDPIGGSRARRTAYLAIGRFHQQRFDEAAALVKDFVHQTDSPRGFAILAASCGHLGRIREAQSALAGYRDRTPLPIEDFGARLLSQPAHLRLFLDGIALAEGKSPIEGEGAG